MAFAHAIRHGTGATGLKLAVDAEAFMDSTIDAEYRQVVRVSRVAARQEEHPPTPGALRLPRLKIIRGR